MTRGLLIKEIQPGTLAEELELEPGDRLAAINGTALRDLIDYEFHISDDPLSLEIIRRSGEVWEIEVERDEGESLGLVFLPPAPKRCGNNCLFCFVHQLPQGLRKPLYVKDEDYRLSFLYGTYITLTNLTRKDLVRIREQRLSPLYISVHATDPAVRERLLGRSGLPPVIDLLRYLTEAGIILHTQVVLCPGINDGEVLERTVSDLAGLYPGVVSLAIVPVGLTRYREWLPELQPVTAEYARAFVSRWLPEAEHLAERLGEPFLFLADEFFIRGGVPFPSLTTYGDFPQLENGVGMIPLFLDEAEEVIRDAVRLPPVRVTVVTGVSAYPFLREFLERLASATGAAIEVVAVPNRLFGAAVTVTGLVAGRDIIELLKDRAIGTVLFIPDVMLKEGEGSFIDDVTVDGLAEALGCEVLVVPATPWGVYEGLQRLGVKYER
jgi:putative radical SAM enzyme (TIGR03279 family)